jgi:putative CRISPR-associated protein (TIGR02619 family)
MIKIITMVGTSLVENYIRDTDDHIVKNYVDDLNDQGADSFDAEKDRINAIKSKVLKWVEGKRYASAEIKSLIQLRKNLNGNIEVYFLCSDTVISKLCGEILLEVLKDFSQLEDIRVVKSVIKGLQVNDRSRFNKEGMPELLYEIFRIAGEYWSNIIINITGGYKATVPYLTILAQVNGCPIYYIFEKEEALIEIPYIPIDIKWEIFRNHEYLFSRLERGEERLDYVPENIKSLLEGVDNIYWLNPLGDILWKRYRERFEIFYLSEEAGDYIENRKEHNKVIDNTLLELARRVKEQPQHPDLHHDLIGYTPPSGFYCFKHKVEGIHIRVLYKTQEWKTKLSTIQKDIYIACIRAGHDVHNVNNEYVAELKRVYPKERQINLDEFKSYRIEKNR